MARKTKSFARILKATEKTLPGGQKELARKLGVSSRALRYWKSGERSPSQSARRSAINLHRRRITKPHLEKSEVYMPKGQSHLARSLGVSERTVRYWKTGERKPTKEHQARLDHLYYRTENYLKLLQKHRGLSKKQALDLTRKHYLIAEKEMPEIPEGDKWLPVYKKEEAEPWWSKLGPAKEE